MKQLLFLCISLAILLFSVIVTNVAPIIKGKVGQTWSFYSCKYYSDNYDYTDKNYQGNDKKEELDKIKKNKTRCDRRKAMKGLEYVTSNLNIIFGFVCAFAGFLLYQKIGNLGGDAKYIGLIGLGCGVIGFVLTLVYVIESGLIFTDLDIRDLDDTGDVRIDSDGAFLEWDSGKKRYTCIFYKKDKEDSLYLRYSDYGNKYLNYYKDITINDNKKKYNMYNRGCSHSVSEDDLYELCQALSSTKSNQELLSDNNPYSFLYYNNDNKITYTKKTGEKDGECDKIYYPYSTPNNNKKITYDYWLTSLIFSCFIMVLYICLALFGFLLFKDGGSSGSSGPVSIK